MPITGVICMRKYLSTNHTRTNSLKLLRIKISLSQGFLIRVRGLVGLQNYRTQSDKTFECESIAPVILFIVMSILSLSGTKCWFMLIKRAIRINALFQ